MTTSKKYRELSKEHVEDPDSPAVADEDGDGEHAEWTKIGLLLVREDIGKPLRHCEDHLHSDVISSLVLIGDSVD